MKFCLTPGCRTLTAGTHCTIHGGARDVLRPTAQRRGYGKRWRQYTQAFLAEHPFCVALPGERCTAASSHVDHIEAVTGPDDPRFWFPSNHQALCGTCHRRKTNRYDGGFGNPKRPFERGSA